MLEGAGVRRPRGSHAFPACQAHATEASDVDPRAIDLRQAAEMAWRQQGERGRILALRAGLPAEARGRIVLAPLMGWDAAGYRPGQGGGFIDETLAILDPRPLMMGVGPRAARPAGTLPQPHDIVTETGVQAERGTEA